MSKFKVMHAPAHPLDPLSPVEINKASATIRSYILENKLPISVPKFSYLTLIEPKKSELTSFLNLFSSEGSPPKNDVGPPARRAESAVICTLSGYIHLFKMIFDFAQNSVLVESVEKLPLGTQSGITVEELLAAEAAVIADPRVIKLCAEVGIEAHQIVADCWSIGYDLRFGPERRLQQAFVYARFGENEHLYAHPLDFSCVVDSNSLQVLYIEFASHRKNGSDILPVSGTTFPHDITKDSLVQSGRERFAPPMTSIDYLPELLERTTLQTGEPWSLRTDIKPLEITQPEGVSFTLEGNRLKWQNWDLHIGYNYREAMILNQVQYFDKDEGKLRPILYRMSYTEMVVPYSSNETPHPRKFAFDIGEYGLGALANSLEVGVCCKGSIAYLDGTYTNGAGQAMVIPNAVCIHEEDDGILWKHTDFRSGKSHSARSRKLVISMVFTVANYEYGLAWTLRQDASIEMEIKLTGILNIYGMAQGEKAGSFGTEVAPQVLAHHHQHIFCLRIDPMIDGLLNSAAETDIIPIPYATGSPENYMGNGFISQKTILQESGAGRRYDAEKGRMWSLINEDKRHYASGEAIGYKIMCKDFPPLLAQPDSIVALRAPFATKNFWVTPYEDEQLYPAGKFVTQTLVAPEDSLEGWSKGSKSIAKADIVAWVSFGVTHLPRPEDFPVMPVESLRLMMKPVGFFRSNPALDVPQLKDTCSIRAPVSGSDHENGNGNGNVLAHVGVTGTNGSSCCN